MPQIDIRNCDCMELMAEYPDKYFELAIVDPPYGLRMDKNAYKNGINCIKNGFKKHLNKKWDKNIPDKQYFHDLFRVSKNQIIWGANYFAKYLPPSMGWVFWYKMQKNFSFSDGEFAFTSFDCKARIFEYARGNESGFAPGGSLNPNIHPTQKPVKLYRWLLERYAKPGDKILDTHMGSGSIAIACHYMGYDLTACELDADYYNAAMKRIKEETAQLAMF